MISYFHRHSDCGFSIEKVFNIIIDDFKKNKKVEEYFMPSKRSTPLATLKNSFFAFSNRNKKGINHITGHIHDVVLGLFGHKIVLTIHDLVFIDNVKNPIKRFYKWLLWLYIPVKFSDSVVCISNHTKNNLLKYIDSKKIRVIYNPVDPSFSFTPKDFDKQKPIILHIGTGWNKNIKRVAQALVNTPCHLRIVGKLSLEQKEILKLNSIDYSNVFNLSDDDIRKEYTDCDIVSFPSEYEGFGMPLIEGQKIGRVVVTSRIEPLIEIAGEGACYVNPFDINSIRDGFLKVINENIYRAEKIKLGRINVRRFDVEKIVEEYSRLYEELLK